MKTQLTREQSNTKWGQRILRINVMNKLYLCLKPSVCIIPHISSKEIAFWIDIFRFPLIVDRNNRRMIETTGGSLIRKAVKTNHSNKRWEKTKFT